MKDLPVRKNIRLKDYDYSSNGAYFLTICVKNRHELLGKIVGDGVLDVPKTADINGTSGRPSPTNAVIPSFISTFKRFTHKQVGFSFWQRAYNDHIIRDEEDFKTKWNYIDENPARWISYEYYGGKR